MAYENTVTITGNITREPELRFIPSGTAVADFSMAWNKYVKDGEDESHYFDVTVWSDLAENAAETLSKGMRVTVVGSLDYQTWETEEGKRSKVKIKADEISPSLRFATASVTKIAKGGGGGGSAPSKPKAKAKPEYDEEPF